jgi:hypothetical protein
VGAAADEGPGEIQRIIARLRHGQYARKPGRRSVVLQTMRGLQVQDLAVAVNENTSAGPVFSVLEGHQFHAFP